MRLIIKALSNKPFEMSIDDNSTLLDLKKKIEVYKNTDEPEKSFPAEKMCIIFNGKQLPDNNKKVTEYDIVNDSHIVFLILKDKPTQTPPSPTQPVASVQPAPQQPPPAAQLPILPQINPQQGNQALQQLLMQFMTSPNAHQINPATLGQSLNNQALTNFLQNLGNLQEEDDPLFDKVFDGDLELSQEEKSDVDEIMKMGFQYEDAVQYYIAFDRNKEAAITALYNETLDDNDENQ